MKQKFYRFIPNTHFFHIKSTITHNYAVELILYKMFTSYWTTFAFNYSFMNGFLRPKKYDLALDKAITGKL